MIKLLAILSTVLLIGCGKNTEENSVVKFDEPEHAVNSEKAVVETPVTQTLTCVGRTVLLPDAQQEIFGRVDAYVQEVHVQEGQYIKAQQVIISLESPEFARLQKEYLIAQSEYKYQKMTLARNTVLYEQKSISKQEYDEITRNHDSALANYNGQGTELKSMGFSLVEIDKNNLQSSLLVRSPIAGQIDHINVVNGTRIDSEHLLLSIWNSNGLMIELNMLAEDAASISEGDTFTFTLPGRQGDHKGKIKYKSMVVKEDNQTVSLFATIQESHQEIAAGESIFAQFLPNK